MTKQTRKFKEVSYNEFVLFEKEGESVQGEIIKFREISTEFGVANVIDLATEDGEKKSLIVSSGMGVIMELNHGDYIKVTYTGDKKNPKTRRTYRSFKVEVAE